jgi:hypothetical protein
MTISVVSNTQIRFAIPAGRGISLHFFAYYDHPQGRALEKRS